MAESTETLSWADDRLERITRIRLVSDPGLPYWFVNYAIGVDGDGEQVGIDLPFDRVPKAGWKGHIIGHARKDSVYLAELCGGDIDHVISRRQ